MTIEHSVTAFLGRHNFDIHGPSVNSITNALLFDMAESLKSEPVFPLGAGAAMDMIPTWMLPPEQPPKNTSVIVIDAGGTNFRSCLVSFDSTGVPTISHFQRKPMPATERVYTRDEFFQTIASYLDHLKNTADCIGFCFSYALKIRPDGDGEVLKFSKEIHAPEVVGSLLGKNLNAALSARGWNTLKRIALINDTAAALLAGAATGIKGKKYSSYVGFILGTGINAAYIEYGSIPKLKKVKTDIPHLPAQIIVCESGKFNKLQRSRFDESVAASTDTPDLFLFEKMSSGAYLGTIGVFMLHEACRDGLFSEETHSALSNLKKLSLIDINAFLTQPYDNSSFFGVLLSKATDNDRETLYRLFDALIARTARLAAANIAAVVIKTGKGFNPLQPVCILVEGTTFLKTWSLRTAVTAHLRTVLTEQRGIYFDIQSLDNAVTFGTAIAGGL